MNTVNGLFKEITSVENLVMAVENAAKHKRKKRVVRNALRNKYRIARELHRKLIEGTWRPCEVHNVKVINDGVNLKKREIVCPSFVNEQVVHHAIIQVLKPYFMRRFYRYSCASIPGRGTEYAIKYIRRSLEDYRGTKYFTKFDIKGFFNNIRPSKVFRALRRIIRDKKVLLLLALVLRGNKVKLPNGEFVKRGTPIGLYTSPWFANILLTPLDNMVKQSIKYYVRYNDDMLLMSSNKRVLKKVAYQIRDYLGTIGLSVKGVWQIHKVNEVKNNYIGVTISRDKIVLTSKVFLKAKRMAKRIHKKGFVTIYDARKIISYSGRFKHLDTRQAYLMYIEKYVSRKKCRKIISKGGEAYVDEVIFQGKAIAC